MSLELLTLEQVAAKLTISLRTLRRMIDRDEFIRPVRITTRRMAFRRDQVDAWIELQGQRADDAKGRV